MTQVQQKVYLLTEQQRDALLNYLLNRPYREVAAGVEFLNNAPTTMLNIDLPDEQAGSMLAEQEFKAQINGQEEGKIEVVNAPTEELAVLSRT
ncbi:hypothetical protein [Anabaena sp. UHCC 0399]|uniref:hypothetical protein n=1 Tax=Anabaena sp. UHCC 0399 TaxID=3110238 RepID=UPI002B1EDE99|nr:hypothetical protein [Anabaena sp. UHCC 0399]MEA5569031.1 hypothetical protein [Anabaena sp. UHCC 0399]